MMLFLNGVRFSMCSTQQLSFVFCLLLMVAGCPEKSDGPSEEWDDDEWGDEASGEGGDEGSESASPSVTAAPTAQITTPTEGESVTEGGLYVARGLVSDPDDVTESLIVQWFIGDEETPRGCPQGTHPDSDGITKCDVSFSVDKSFIRLRVEDSDGNSSQDTVNVNVVGATAPAVTISEPISGAEYRETDWINFVGTVYDEEDSPESLTVFWESDVEGLLDLASSVDSGGTVAASGTLVPGVHIVRLTAEDSTGRQSTAETVVMVYPAQSAPVVSLTTPSSGDTFSSGELVVFEAAVSDERDTPDELDVIWTSSRDGVIGMDSPDSAGTARLAISELSNGEHLITITVTDKDSSSTSASLVIEVVEGGD